VNFGHRDDSPSLRITQNPFTSGDANRVSRKAG